MLIGDDVKRAAQEMASKFRAEIQSRLGNVPRDVVVEFATAIIDQELDMTGANVGARGGCLLYVIHRTMKHSGELESCEKCAEEADNQVAKRAQATGLDLDTLAGILHAQRAIDNILPVISSRQGLLQELQLKLGELPQRTNESIRLMEALICLQAHCRSLGMVKVGR